MPAQTTKAKGSFARKKTRGLQMFRAHHIKRPAFFVSILAVTFLIIILLSPSILLSSAFGTQTSTPLKQSYPKTLSSPNNQPEGWFGYSVATSGKLAIVGAPAETANGQSYAGHAYLFNSGKLTETLTSPNAYNSGEFGYSVGISGDLAIVGAYGEKVAGYLFVGRAYVFNATSGALIETLNNPKFEGQMFGWSVAISGGLAIVGAPYQNVGGDAYVFNAYSGKMVSNLTSPNVQSEADFGYSVAISGKQEVVGAVNQTENGYLGAGAVYVYNSGKIIQSLASPNAQQGGEFGVSVGIGGNVAIVGAEWETVDGHYGAGHAYLFSASGGKLLLTLSSPDTQAYGFFGTSVATTGKLAIVGGYDENGGEGGAFVYNVSTGKLVRTLSSPNAKNYGLFGWSVGISGNHVIVGAPFEDPHGVYEAGHAYLF